MLRRSRSRLVVVVVVGRGARTARADGVEDVLGGVDEPLPASSVSLSSKVANERDEETYDAPNDDHVLDERDGLASSAAARAAEGLPAALRKEAGIDEEGASDDDADPEQAARGTSARENLERQA